MKRILCIDDDQDILDCLCLILGDGYEVKTSVTPANIFELIQEQKPDLILMDINMEPFNGLEICKAIKSYISTEKTPIIIVSSDERIHTAVRDYGATDILLKPFNIDSLNKIVNLYLQSTIVKLFPETGDTENIKET